MEQGRERQIKEDKGDIVQGCIWYGRTWCEWMGLLEMCLGRNKVLRRVVTLDFTVTKKNKEKGIVNAVEHIDLRE